MDQLRQRRGIESEPLSRHIRNQAGAGDVRRIVKLPAIGRLAHREHLGRAGLRLPRQKIAPVIGGKKRALVMVEPPRHPGRGGVFKVHYRVLALDERRLVEERPRRLVHQPMVRKLLRRPDALAMKAREQRRRACAIEAMIVIEHAAVQAEILRTKPNLRSQTRASAQHPATHMRSSRIDGARVHVKQQSIWERNVLSVCTV